MPSFSVKHETERALHYQNIIYEIIYDGLKIHQHIASEIEKHKIEKHINPFSAEILWKIGTKKSQTPNFKRLYLKN